MTAEERATARDFACMDCGSTEGRIEQDPEKHEKRSHFFVDGATLSLCRTCSIEEELIDPRAARENPRLYCLKCWQVYCTPLSERDRYARQIGLRQRGEEGR